MIEFLAIVAVVAMSFADAPRRRTGCRVNDLRRWKKYGGTLDRPRPPCRFTPRTEEDAA